MSGPLSSLDAQFYMNYLVSRARAAVAGIQRRWDHRNLQALHRDLWMARMLKELVGFWH